MRHARRTILVAALVLTAAALAGVAQPHLARTATPATGRTIVVGGTGSVAAVPDRASFQFGVDTTGRTAADALDRNSTAAAAVISALKAAGVANSDLQTAGVSLSPQMSQDGTSIVGYAASNSVTATVSLAKAGSLVDAAVGAGADSVSGPGLDRSDRASLYRDALKQAVADAQTKAEAIAAAAGLQLGAVQSISEGSSAPPPIPVDARAAGASVPTPIEPGTQEIDATVTVTYAVG